MRKLLSLLLMAGLAAALTVEVSPQNPVTADDLECVVSGGTPETFEWLENGAPMDAPLQNTLSSSFTSKHGEYSCLVNGVDSGSATVLNSAPNVTVTVPNGGEAFTSATNVSWTAFDADGDAFAIFLAFYSSDAGASWQYLGFYGGEQRSFSFDPGFDGNRFLVRVMGFDWEGAVDVDDSDAVFSFDRSPPEAPHSLHAQGLSNASANLTNNSQFTLVWEATDDPVSGTEHYAVYRNGSQIAQPTAKNYSESAPGNGYHCYRVTQTDFAGWESPASNEYCITVADLTPPELVEARTTSPNELELEFSEDLNESTIEECSFTVEGNAVTGFTEDGGIVTLQLQGELGGDDTPLVSDNPACLIPEDLAGNQLEPFNSTAEDGVPPEFLLIQADAPSYFAGDTITLTIEMDLPGYSLSADFSTIDSGYSQGAENVSSTNSTYTVNYRISAGNTRNGSLSTGYGVILTATDSSNNAAQNSSTLYYDASTPGSISTHYSVDGDYALTVSGAGLRSGNANLSVNAEGPIEKAFLYWQTRDSPNGEALYFNGSQVNGSQTGGIKITVGDQTREPASFRADVTALVSQGSHSYAVSGEFEGATLAVVYGYGRAAFIRLNDGCANPRFNASTQFDNFSMPARHHADLHLSGGSASDSGVVGASFNSVALSASSWDQSAGLSWDADSFDVTALMGSADSQAIAGANGFGSVAWGFAALYAYETPEQPSPSPTPPVQQGGSHGRDVPLSQLTGGSTSSGGPEIKGDEWRDAGLESNESQQEKNAISYLEDVEGPSATPTQEPSPSPQAPAVNRLPDLGKATGLFAAKGSWMLGLVLLLLAGAYAAYKEHEKRSAPNALFR